jgi:hypothetical protein
LEEKETSNCFPKWHHIEQFLKTILGPMSTT